MEKPTPSQVFVGSVLEKSKWSKKEIPHEKLNCYDVVMDKKKLAQRDSQLLYEITNYFKTMSTKVNNFS